MSVKTITSLQESNAFRKTPELLGGQKDSRTEVEASSDSGMLVMSVDKMAYEQIKAGAQDLVICIDSPFWKSRLRRHFNLIKIFCGNMKGEFIICEYEGYWISKWSYKVRQGNYRKPVNPGDFILKIGSVLTEKK